MSGLARVLRRTTERRLEAGGAVSNNVINALSIYRRRLFVTFLVLFTILLCLVAFGTYGLAVSLKKPDQLKLFVGAMGISVGGLVEGMRRIWKEWSQAELLLILVEDASESQVTALIDKIIQKI